MASIVITAPSSAEEGERVSASVRVKSTLDYHASYRGDIKALPDLYPDYVIGEIDQIILAGDSVTVNVSFTMPDCNTTVFLWLERWSFDHWVYDSSASKVVSLEIPVPETFHLSIHVPSWAAGGYVDPGSGDYPAYSTVKLTAHPLSGYQFTNWGGDASGTSPTYNLYMDSNKSVEAYFEKVPVEPFDPWNYDLNGDGYIDKSERAKAVNDYYAGIITKGQLDQVLALPSAPPTTFHLSILVPSWAAGGYVEPGSGDYPANTTVKLTAHPLSGYQFTNWGGDASGTSPTYNLYMDSDKNVEAYFEPVPVPETFHLSILVPPWAAGGYVDPGSGDYPADSTVTLTAHPLSGYQFTSWGGDASGISTTFNLYMNSDKNVEAYFEPVPVPETYHLSIYIPPWAAGGYVDPGSGDYPAYSTVKLTAHPLSGYQFTGWGGDASGISPTYNLYMNSDKNVEAYFEKVPVEEFVGTIIRKELKYDGKGTIPVY